MAIPDYQTVMLPLLRFAGDRQEHSLRETIDALAEEFALTDEERKALLPSGQQQVFDNRVGWARTYLTTPSARKDDASPFRPFQPPGGLMEPTNASLQRGRQG